MSEQTWWMTTDEAEGRTFYGIAHRVPDGTIWRYEMLTEHPKPVQDFLSRIKASRPEEYHTAELMEDLITSLYLPQEPLA
ncbi:MAG: hypothetical protein IJZ13_08445 [Clostridia bacterium]|nr:hypothetical protein [Clostridia bacterium]